MNIPAITDALTAVTPLSQSSAATPPISAQEQFAALLESPAAAGSPNTLLAAQATLNQMTVGTELTAKLAGSLTQSINKLVNMQ